MVARMGLIKMLARCFRPPPSDKDNRAKRAREEYEAEKRRWVGDQMGRILEYRLRRCTPGGGGECGAVDVSRYGGIALEQALAYEFDRRWWFAQTARLLAEAEAAASKSGGSGSHKIHALESTEQSAPAKH